jgi:hypothetical protein
VKHTKTGTDLFFLVRSFSRQIPAKHFSGLEEARWPFGQAFWLAAEFIVSLAHFHRIDKNDLALYGFQGGDLPPTLARR